MPCATATIARDNTTRSTTAEAVAATVRAGVQGYHDHRRESAARVTLLRAVRVLQGLVRDDGTDDDHASRVPATDACQALDLLGWREGRRRPQLSPVDWMEIGDAATGAADYVARLAIESEDGKQRQEYRTLVAALRKVG